MQVFEEIDLGLLDWSAAAVLQDVDLWGQYHDDPQLALWQISKFDLLDSNGLASGPVDCFVDLSKSPFAQALGHLLVSISASPWTHSVCRT